jgi:hypothetical protein
MEVDHASILPSDHPIWKQIKTMFQARAWSYTTGAIIRVDGGVTRKV